MSHPIVDQELALLEAVHRALAGEVPDRTASAQSELVRELERLRSLLVSGQEQKDQLALLEQWDRSNALLRQLQASASAPRVDRDSPYFAHLRLLEGGRERDVCLGKATCIRDGVRIVDWRNAPISRLFYRYQQGEPYEEELGGRTASGEVTARRTVSIRAAELQRVDAPEGSFSRSLADGAWTQLRDGGPRLSGGEGTALRSSGERPGLRSDKRLPEIASLLDTDQFELISRPGSGFLVVRGSAGSGKTTVALHRIAFLAFSDPEIDSTRTLFLTLSPALRDYVSHVLPGLGVQRARVSTFQQWARSLRRRLLPDLPVAIREHTPDMVRRLKLHPALAPILEQHVRRHPGPATAAQALDDWTSVLSNAPILEEGFARHAPDSLGSDDLGQAADWCRARHEELTAWLEGDEDAPAALDPEDDALLLRVWQLRVGPLPNRRKQPLSYRHVAVDEVQDFSPLELRVVLDCLDERTSVTLAGDTQQQISLHGGSHSWRRLLEWLDLPEPDVQTLHVTYRSTRPIMEFGRAVLGPLWEEDSAADTPRDGPPVEVLRFEDHGGCVAFLAEALRRLAREEPLASVAVLTSGEAMTDLYAGGLEDAEVPRVRRVERQRFSFSPGVEVTEVEQAKGLEFDYVVLVDVGAAAYPVQPSARRRLHVGATRAVHQLWVTHVGEPSPLLA